MSFNSSPVYAAVDSDSEKDELDGFLEQSKPAHDIRRRLQDSAKLWWLLMAPWLLSAFFAALTLLLLIERRNNHDSYPFGTYEEGFTSDLIPAEQIPLEQVRFTRSPNFFANGTGWLAPVDESADWPENMVLFGDPSPEIDANWERYIGARYFSISEEEAKRAWGDQRFDYVDESKGGYSAGLEVFHTLHCVNALRIALHPEYYHHHSGHGPFHVEHCLDAIRQTVQCYGSTTLIPTRFREGMKHNYIDSDQVHTCRSFTFLRDFTTSRAKGHENYIHRDKSLIDGKKHEIAVKWKEAQRKHRGKHGSH